MSGIEPPAGLTSRSGDAPASSGLEERCLTCGAPRTGPFCSQCGQERHAGRHTLRRLILGGLGRVVGVDSGFVHTAAGLTVAPHRVVGDYIAGRTARYTHPFAYLVITFAVFAVIGELLTVNVSGGGSSNRSMTALVVPFVALTSRLVFLRGRFNLAEHLILVVYLFAQIALLLAALQLLVPLLTVTAMRVLLVGAMAIALAYFVWAYSRIFDRRPWLAALGAFAAMWSGVVLWAIALMGLVRITQ